MHGRMFIKPVASFQLFIVGSLFPLPLFFPLLFSSPLVSFITNFLLPLRCLYAHFYGDAVYHFV